MTRPWYTEQALWLVVGLVLFGAGMTLTTLIVAFSLPAVTVVQEQPALSKTSWRRAD